MTEVLDVIYTKEQGQIATTIYLRHIPSFVWLNKDNYEQFLLSTYYALMNNRHPIDEIKDKSELLFKISTCIYSEKMETPEWYEGWDGKFYYNQDKLRYK